MISLAKSLPEELAVLKCQAIVAARSLDVDGVLETSMELNGNIIRCHAQRRSTGIVCRWSMNDRRYGYNALIGRLRRLGLDDSE